MGDTVPPGSLSRGGETRPPLKDRNRAPLSAALVANLIVFIAAVKTGSIFGPRAEALLEDWPHLVPAAAGVILAGLANGLIDPDNKARLVFWRWNNPLPGSRAFSHYVHRDPRIDVSALERNVGPFPTEPRAQNALWYKLYKSVEHESAVVDAHRNFLLMRDYAAMSFLLLLGAGIMGILLIPSSTTGGGYVVLLLAQYLLSRLAAANYGVRFVTTVLALKTVS